MTVQSSTYKTILEESRRRLSRLVDRRSVAGFRKLYNNAQADLVRKLAKLGPSSQTFTAHQHRLFLAQIRQGKALLASRMNGELGDLSLEAQREAIRGLSKDITALEAHFTGADIVLPIDEAARFQGLITGRRESLLREHADSIAKYSSKVVMKMEHAMSISMLTGENLGGTIDRISSMADMQLWKAEEIARTETIWAYNAAQYDGLREVAAEIPDMMMRWNEYVSDSTGAPLDDRVASDSEAMHGQVAPAGGMFYFPNTMPDGGAIPKRSKHLVGGSWESPPNRPNDRASLSPWRQRWGIPGWKCVHGARVEIT